MALIKFVETSDISKVTDFVPGRYIICDNGDCYYDPINGTTVNNRVKLSPTPDVKTIISENPDLKTNTLYDVFTTSTLNVNGNTKIPSDGDVLIVKQSIGDTDKYSYTSYHYEAGLATEENPSAGFVAMDGNYSADNVYLSTDITLAGNYTSVGCVNKGSNAATKDAGWDGMSISSILSSIFTQELTPSKPTPSVSEFKLSNAGAIEIGSTITPSFSVKFDPKTYAYGSASDNGKANGSTYSTPSTATVTTSSGESLTGTMTSNSITLTGEPIKVSSSTNYSGTKASIVYGDGVIPWTNTGKEYAASQVKGGTVNNNNKTSSITGYYAKYWLYTTDSNVIADPANVTSVSQLTNANKVQTIPGTATNSGMRQIFFVVPTGTVSSVSVIASTTIPFGTAVKGKTIDVTDASGVDTYKCDVWYISQPAPGANNETYTISLS